MSINQGLLNAVGVGHPALTAVVEAAATASGSSTSDGEGGPDAGSRGFAAKLTGAGGGGCAIILSPIPYVPRSGGSSGAVDSAQELRLHGLVETIR